MNTEPAHTNLPPCIKVGDDGTVSWWAPDRTGDDQDDYDAGVRTFRAAQEMAACKVAYGLLAQLVIAMREIGPYELGFMDAFASAAAYYDAPCFYTEAHIWEQIEESGWAASADEFRTGNQDAWRDRQEAAMTNDTGKIVRGLLKLVLGPLFPWTQTAYLHSLSIAACKALTSTWQN